MIKSTVHKGGTLINKLTSFFLITLLLLTMLSVFIATAQQPSLTANLVYTPTHCASENIEHCNESAEVITDMHCCVSVVTHYFYSETPELLAAIITTQQQNNVEFNPQPLLGAKTTRYRPPIV